MGSKRSAKESETTECKCDSDGALQNPEKRLREKAVLDCATEGDLCGLKEQLAWLLRSSSRGCRNSGCGTVGTSSSSTDHRSEETTGEWSRSKQPRLRPHAPKTGAPEQSSFRLSALRDQRGSTPLHYAAGNGHLAVCRYLLETVREEGRGKRPRREEEGEQQRWQRLREESTKPFPATFEPDQNNNIDDSSNYDDSYDVSSPSERYYCSEYVNLPNRAQGRTALHWAARNGHLDVCEFLVLEGGANPNALAKGGVTPLQLAVWMAHVDVCLALERMAGGLAGATAKNTPSSNANDDSNIVCHGKHFVNSWGCSVHHWLGKSPVYEQEQAKQKQHPNAEADRDHVGRTATDRLLALCHWLDDEDGGDDRSNDQADPWNRPNDHGQTPLHKAGFGGNLPVVRFLLDTKGLADDQRDSQHNTAADCAERNQQWATARYLRRHGNPGCLARAKALLLGPEAPATPALSEVRAAYQRLARLRHPDRWKTHGGNDAAGERDGNRCTDNAVEPQEHSDAERCSREWESLQQAYRLWTLWWKDPEEADALIRSLERHEYLQAQLPLLILWHDDWHAGRPRQQNQTTDRQKQQHKLPSNTDGNRSGRNQESSPSQSSPKRQKVRPRSFSPEARSRLDDFERRLARLLATLPERRIPLSQLPKEYEKTWGRRNGGDGQESSRHAMIRPRDYRCKKLGYLLERHCARTVEVVHLRSSSSPAAASLASTASEAGTKGRIAWVRLKDTTS